MGRVSARELALLGAHGMPARDYPELLDLVGTGALAPAQLVARVLTLAEAPAALAALGDPAAYPGVTVLRPDRSDRGWKPGAHDPDTDVGKLTGCRH
jgi:alcohol dehydrogenase